MHAYIVTGKTHDDRLEWGSQFFDKAKIEEIVNIAPEDKNIVIESIRQLAHRLSFAPENPKLGRGVVIENAHLLTLEAANAFLKTLEEPPGKTIFVLTAPNKDVVLETIASRATCIDLGPAIFEMTDEEKQEAQDIFEKLTKAGIGERLQFLDTIKNRQEAIRFVTHQIFTGRQNLLAQIPVLDPILHTKYYISLLKQLEQTRQDLAANTNVKLAIGNLLLNYPHTTKQNTRG